jgi:hypothetical protein
MSDVVSPRKQASPATELDDLPVLRDSRTEILLRVPAPPPTLLCVSHVWRQQCLLIADPSFLCSFRACHNDAPPLIGVFHNSWYDGARRFTLKEIGAYSLKEEGNENNPRHLIIL